MTSYRTGHATPVSSRTYWAQWACWARWARYSEALGKGGLLAGELESGEHKGEAVAGSHPILPLVLGLP
jgi:hypothetical protein